MLFCHRRNTGVSKGPGTGKRQQQQQRQVNLCYFLVVAALVILVLVVVVVGVSDKLIKNIIITYLSSRTDRRPHEGNAGRRSAIVPQIVDCVVRYTRL